VSRGGSELSSAPLFLTSEVVLVGTAGVTTPALHALLENGIPLVMLTRSGRAKGRLECPADAAITARFDQLARAADPRYRLDIAKACVKGKLHNQRAHLSRRASVNEHAEPLHAFAEQIRRSEDKVATATSVEQVVGLEGAASASYFRAFRLLLPPAAGFRVRGRHEPDVVNALVNYCSALLRETVLAAIVTAGLEPQISFLHTPMRGRPTLAFDLMEEWRPVLVEPTVLALLHLRIVTPDDIEATDDGPRLTPEATAAAIRRFRSRLDGPARSYPERQGHPSYGHCIVEQAYALRRWIVNGSPAYQAFGWR
jgi:CRISPR-associated protein Cas1